MERNDIMVKKDTDNTLKILATIFLLIVIIMSGSTQDKLIIAITFIVPGFIILKIWGLLDWINE